MDDTTLLIIGAGALTFLLVGDIGKAFASDIVGVAGHTGFIDKALVEISGANWTTPLFLTLERDVPLGAYGLDTLFSVGGTIAKGIYTGASYVGNTVGTALSTANQIISGTVIPAVINASGTVATFVAGGAKDIWSGISTGASYAGSGLAWVGGKAVDIGKVVGGAVITEVKALPGQIVTIGKGVWDYTKIAGGYVWDKVTGTFKYVGTTIENSTVLKTAAKAVVGLGASVVISKNIPSSDVSTNQQKILTGDIPGPNTPQIIPLGYLSKTSFDTPKALIVRKLYNAQMVDTRIVTDDVTYNASLELGYKEEAILGYCSPEPFLGAVNMISMFNPNTLDSIVITNYDILPQMEKLGYQSLGTIGYCKAI